MTSFACLRTMSRRDWRGSYVTHRCEGSLKAYMSIRNYERIGHWALIDYEPDWEGNPSRYVGRRIATISYCPFCGKKLLPENVPF